MKLIRLLVIILFVSSSPKLSASHIIGGAITWDYFGNNKYVFHLNVYRDCSGIPIGIGGRQLSIYPYPLDSAGNIINSINVGLDTTKWSANNNWNLAQSAFCNASQGFDCANGDPGAIQPFYYKSDTIELYGTPPTYGWTIRHEVECCFSGQIANFAYSGVSNRASLKAKMYTNGPSVSYSSPTLLELPNYAFCTDNEYNEFLDLGLNQLDSVTYHLDIATTNTGSAVNYYNGFSYFSPTPNQGMNPNNIPLSLDTSSGRINFKVASSFGINYYYTVVRVDGWKGGNKVSSIYNEWPIAFFSCGIGMGGIQNKKPEIEFPSPTNNTSIYQESVAAGGVVNIPIKIIDTMNQGSQQIAAYLNGDQLSLDRSSTVNCKNPNDSSCAIVFPFPQFDTSVNRYELKAQDSINLSFVWQTNCSHLGPNKSALTYDFSIKTYDDNCPIAAKNEVHFKIKVLPSSNCLTTSLGANESLDLELKVYPNPSSGVLNIFSATEDIQQLKLSTLHGQTVLQKQVTAKRRIRIEQDLAPGVYLVEILSSKNNRAYKKVIIQ